MDITVEERSKLDQSYCDARLDYMMDQVKKDLDEIKMDFKKQILNK